jgi:hypothetical protein
MKNGDKIRITYIPPCKNGLGTPNPYIGMEGEVHDFDENTFNLRTETSWLVGIRVKTCKFIPIIPFINTPDPYDQASKKVNWS